MIVEEYKLGNTLIRIHDDAYRDKTEMDINAILERVARIGKEG